MVRTSKFFFLWKFQDHRLFHICVYDVGAVSEGHTSTGRSLWAPGICLVRIRSEKPHGESTYLYTILEMVISVPGVLSSSSYKCLQYVERNSLAQVAPLRTTWAERPWRRWIWDWAAGLERVLEINLNTLDYERLTMSWKWIFIFFFMVFQGYPSTLDTSSLHSMCTLVVLRLHRHLYCVGMLIGVM